MKSELHSLGSCLAELFEILLVLNGFSSRNLTLIPDFAAFAGFRADDAEGPCTG